MATDCWVLGCITPTDDVQPHPALRSKYVNGGLRVDELDVELCATHRKVYGRVAVTNSKRYSLNFPTVLVLASRMSRG
jgi:hypothetical protein